MESGEVEVESIEPISFDDVTAEVAHSCGFATVEDLLRVARHGHGENVYLIRFHYIP